MTNNNLSKLFTFLFRASVRFTARSSMIRREASQPDCPLAPRGRFTVMS